MNEWAFGAVITTLSFWFVVLVAVLKFEHLFQNGGGKKREKTKIKQVCYICDAADYEMLGFVML